MSNDPLLSELYGLGELSDYLGEFAAAAAPKKKPAPARKPVASVSKKPVARTVAVKKAPAKKLTPAQAARAPAGSVARAIVEGKLQQPKRLMPVTAGQLESLIKSYNPSYVKTATGNSPATSDQVARYKSIASSKGLNAFVATDRAGGTVVDGETYDTLQFSAPMPGESAAQAAPAALRRAGASAQARVVQSAAKAKASVAKATTQPSAQGMVKKAVKPLQQALVKLGARIKADGSYGPLTASAWAAAATSVGASNVAMDRASKTEAWVDPNTLTAVMTAAAQGKGKAPVAVPPEAQTAAARAAVSGKVKGTQPTGANTLRVKVEAVQALVKQFGAKIGVDNRWGPKTAAAWTALARKKRLDGRIDRAGPDEAWVVPATYQSLSGGAPLPSAPTAGLPMRAVSVGEAQDLLIKLGENLGKSGRDGKYGKLTAAAWARQVLKHGPAHASLQAKRTGGMTDSSVVGRGVFERIDGYNANVEVRAYNALVWAARAAVAPTTPAPQVPNVPAGSQMDQAAAQLAAKCTVVVSVLTVQQALLASQLAASRPQTLAGLGLAIPRKQGAKSAAITRAAQKFKRPGITTSARPNVARAPTPPSNAGGVRETGRWDAATQAGFLALFRGNPNVIALWQATLPRILSPDGTTIKLLPGNLVTQTETAAKSWQQYKANQQRQPEPGPTPEPQRPGDPMPEPEPTPLPPAPGPHDPGPGPNPGPTGPTYPDPIEDGPYDPGPTDPGGPTDPTDPTQPGGQMPTEASSAGTSNVGMLGIGAVALLALLFSRGGGQSVNYAPAPPSSRGAGARR